MKLHYSQTNEDEFLDFLKFQYLMKLHYSQTDSAIPYWRSCFSTLWNYTTLKRSWQCWQHLRVSVPYEITLLSNGVESRLDEQNVSVPYEITLLSNTKLSYFIRTKVSVPYEITLLSNRVIHCPIKTKVSVPYEITLLSNIITIDKSNKKFQYLMKLHYSQTKTLYVQHYD